MNTVLWHLIRQALSVWESTRQLSLLVFMPHSSSLGLQGRSPLAPSWLSWETKPVGSVWIPKDLQPQEAWCLFSHRTPTCPAFISWRPPQTLPGELLFLAKLQVSSTYHEVTFHWLLQASGFVLVQEKLHYCLHCSEDCIMLDYCWELQVGSSLVGSCSYCSDLPLCELRGRENCKSPPSIVNPLSCRMVVFHGHSVVLLRVLD